MVILDVAKLNIKFVRVFYLYLNKKYNEDIDGLVQDYSNCIANALELIQSCTKPSISTGTSVKTYRAMTSIQKRSVPTKHQCNDGSVS